MITFYDIQPQVPRLMHTCYCALHNAACHWVRAMTYGLITQQRVSACQCGKGHDASMWGQLQTPQLINTKRIAHLLVLERALNDLSQPNSHPPHKRHIMSTDLFNFFPGFSGSHPVSMAACKLTLKTQTTQNHQ